jgi:hypothetical protein
MRDAGNSDGCHRSLDRLCGGCGGNVGIPYGLLNGLSATMAFFTLVSEWMCLTVMDRAKARLAKSELKWDGMDTVNR